MGDEVLLGEFWTPQGGVRLKGAVLPADGFQIKLFPSEILSREPEPKFEEVLVSECETLNFVTFLDCWIEPLHLLHPLIPTSQRIRPRLVLSGGTLAAEKAFSSATYSLAGLASWLGVRDFEKKFDGQSFQCNYRTQVGRKLAAWQFLQVFGCAVPSIQSARTDGIDLRFRELGIIEVRTVEDGPATSSLEDLDRAAVRISRLLQLFLYSSSGPTLIRVGAGVDHALTALRRRSEVDDSNQRFDQIPIPLLAVESDLDSIVSRWDAMYGRCEIALHRLADGLAHPKTFASEAAFHSICSAVASWIQYGSAKGGSDGVAKQFEDLLELARCALSRRDLSLETDLVASARNYLTHGNPDKRVQTHSTSSNKYWVWTRRLTSYLWAAVLSDLGVSRTVLEQAVRRCRSLAYDLSA